MRWNYFFFLAAFFVDFLAAFLVAFFFEAFFAILGITPSVAVMTFARSGPRGPVGTTSGRVGSTRSRRRPGGLFGLGHTLDALEQLRQVEGLPEEARHRQFERAAPHARGLVGGHQDGGSRLSFLAHALEELEAGLSRQAMIEDDDVEAVAGKQESHRGFGAVGGHREVTGVADGVRERAAEQGFVIDDEHAFGHIPPPDFSTAGHCSARAKSLIFQRVRKSYRCKSLSLNNLVNTRAKRPGAPELELLELKNLALREVSCFLTAWRAGRNEPA